MTFLNKYISLIGGLDQNYNQSIINQEIEDFNYYLDNAPNSDIGINKRTQDRIKLTLQDVNFNDQQFQDEKLLCANVNEDLRLGDIVSSHNKDWLLIFTENRTIPSHVSYICRPCNFLLKWIDEDGTIHEQLVVSEDGTKWTTGKKSGTFLDFPDGKLVISLPFNEETETLKVNSRIIYHYKTAYEITYISFTDADTRKKEGIAKLTLKQVETTNDDSVEELGVADYYKYKSKPNVIIIASDTDIVVGNTKKLNVKLILDDIERDDIKPILVSSDNSILSIDSNSNVVGIKEGIVSLNITYKDITNTIQITVKEKTSSVDTYTIEGEDKIMWLCEFDYKIVNNLDSSISKEDYTFSIDYDGNDSDIAELITIDNQTVRIKINQTKLKGKVKLIGTNKNNILDKVEKDIQIVSWNG